MTSNHALAKDECKQLFWAYFSQESQTLLGYVPEVYWPHQTRPEAAEKTTKHWATFTLAHNTSEQVAFTASPRKRHQRAGVITIQLFSSASTTGVEEAERLAVICRDAYENKSTVSGVWFKNCKITEIGTDPSGWFQQNITVEFYYDEFNGG